MAALRSPVQGTSWSCAPNSRLRNALPDILYSGAAVRAGRGRRQGGTQGRALPQPPRPAAGCSIARRHPRRSYRRRSKAPRAGRSRACAACCRQKRALSHPRASPTAAVRQDARSAASSARAGSAGWPSLSGERRRGGRITACDQSASFCPSDSHVLFRQSPDKSAL